MTKHVAVFLLNVLCNCTLCICLAQWLIFPKLVLHQQTLGTKYIVLSFLFVFFFFFSSSYQSSLLGFWTKEGSLLPEGFLSLQASQALEIKTTGAEKWLAADDTWQGKSNIYTFLFWNIWNVYAAHDYSCSEYCIFSGMCEKKFVS